ncbi:MAG: hypothetical protein A2138_00510 [Deltaproteobacteria bacterium RBG_16_71_12]|nr:MAG: hypothetical protein A2138_00510 [Deltaproteobacteria bacterium RBG_16_71_12]
MGSARATRAVRSPAGVFSCKATTESSAPCSLVVISGKVMPAVAVPSMAEMRSPAATPLAAASEPRRTSRILVGSRGQTSMPGVAENSAGRPVVMAATSSGGR